MKRLWQRSRLTVNPTWEDHCGEVVRPRQRDLIQAISATNTPTELYTSMVHTSWVLLGCRSALARGQVWVCPLARVAGGRTSPVGTSSLAKRFPTD
jgi:hypothetical protein